MQNGKIYILCTYNNRGRYVLTATTDAQRADVEARRVVEGKTGEGWNLRETQTITDAQQFDAPTPGDPVIFRVYHLHTTAGEWENVELYRVEELTANISNNGK